MIKALESALLGYAERGADIARLGEKIRTHPGGEGLVENLVGLMVNQRVAEANLVVARVANETGESLVHVVA